MKMKENESLKSLIKELRGSIDILKVISRYISFSSNYGTLSPHHDDHSLSFQRDRIPKSEFKEIIINIVSDSDFLPEEVKFYICLSGL